MALPHSDQRALRTQSAAALDGIQLLKAPLIPVLRPNVCAQTLLKEEVNAWVNEGGRGDDEDP